MVTEKRNRQREGGEGGVRERREGRGRRRREKKKSVGRDFEEYGKRM